MLVIVVNSDGSKVTIELSDQDTVDTLLGKIIACPEFDFADKQFFSLQCDNLDINTAGVFDAWKKVLASSNNEEEPEEGKNELQLRLFSRHCCLSPHQMQNLRSIAKIPLPLAVGVLACISLSLTAAYAPLSPLALGFTIAAAVIALAAGVFSFAKVMSIEVVRSKAQGRHKLGVDHRSFFTAAKIRSAAEKLNSLSSVVTTNSARTEL